MKSLIRQTTFITASNVVTRIIAVLFSVILARVMSVADFGMFKYLIALSTVYAVVFAGIPTALTKFVGEDKGNKALVSDYLSSSLATSILLYLIIAVFISLFSSQAFYVVILVFALLVDSIYLGFTRGLLSYLKLAGYKLVQSVLQVSTLAVFYLIAGDIDLPYAVILFSFSGLISLLIFESIRPEIELRRKIPMETVKKLVRYAIPVSLGAIGWIVMLGTNTIVIKNYFDTDQVGFYGVAMTLAQVFSFLPEAIATILMPRASALRDKERIVKPLWMAVVSSLALSIALLAPLLYYKREIITLVFTEKYIAAAAIILPLSLAQIFISSHQIIAAAWQGLGRPGVPSITISIAAILNIVGSVLLTGRYGLAGAAVSIAVSSFVATIIISIWIAFWARGASKNNLDTEHAIGFTARGQ